MLLSMNLIRAGVGILSVSCSWAFAQPDYGIEFVTIGNAGNRPANEQEAPGLGGYPSGSVAYQYRVARTEVTVKQWHQFLTAYRPFISGSTSDSGLTGFWIADTPDGYMMSNGAEQFPADMSWRSAARFCNWMHNGMVAEKWAFESGVYDTSTFGTNPDGSTTDSLVRSADARYWIPSLDEWTKAAHYDPNRYGQGQEGYWTYFGPDDQPLTPGAPGTQGAETAAGYLDGIELQYPIKSFADVMSPWGLWDVSGGLREMTSASAIEMFSVPGTLFAGSASRLPGGHLAEDRLDYFTVAPTTQAWGGLRVASVVPGSSVVAIFASASCFFFRRSRK